MAGEREKVQGNGNRRGCERTGVAAFGTSTGWKYQLVPKGLPPYVSVAASLVPAGISNRYQWKPKAPVEKPGVLSRGHWSRLRGTGSETCAFGPSQPVPKARFLVVSFQEVDFVFFHMNNNIVDFVFFHMNNNIFH